MKFKFKKTAALILTTVFASAFCTTFFANQSSGEIDSQSHDISASLTFEGPPPHTGPIPTETKLLNLSVGDGGKAIVNDKSYTGIASIEVEKDKKAVIKITQDDGFEIDKVTLNGEDVTKKIRKNILTIETMDDNKDVVIKFKKTFFAKIKEIVSKIFLNTGDNIFPAVIILSGIMILCVALIIFIKKKKSKK